MCFQGYRSRKISFSCHGFPHNCKAAGNSFHTINFADGFHIFCCHICVFFYSIITAIDKYLPSACCINFAVHLVFRSFTNGHNSNDRGNSYNNSQHSKKGAPFIGNDILNCHFDIFNYISHSSVLSLTCQS